MQQLGKLSDNDADEKRLQVLPIQEMSRRPNDTCWCVHCSKLDIYVLMLECTDMLKCVDVGIQCYVEMVSDGMSLC